MHELITQLHSTLLIDLHLSLAIDGAFDDLSQLLHSIVCFKWMKNRCRPMCVFSQIQISLIDKCVHLHFTIHLVSLSLSHKLRECSFAIKQ